MIKTELTKDERAMLRTNREEIRLVLKALQEMVDRQESALLSAPLEPQTLLIERARLQGADSLIRGLKQLLAQPAN